MEKQSSFPPIKIMAEKDTQAEFPLLSIGFRPFFLLASFFAVASMALWSINLGGGTSAERYYGGVIWHSHEMIFGYSGAVIAGFLLTAVGNWTGMVTLTGWLLAVFSLLWLLGRLPTLIPSIFPDAFIFIVDISFFPLLAIVIAPLIIKANKQKSLAFVVLLLVMTVSNLAIHLESLGITETGAMVGIKIALGAIITMIVLIAGRVFPFFTERALQDVEPVRRPTLDILCTLLVAGLFLFDSFWPHSKTAGIVAFALAILNSVRLAGWYSAGVAKVPMLWILYLGYLWIILGLIFMGLSSFSLVPGYIATHAFTIGGIGVVTLGMMARVSLGHTGRIIVAAKPTIIAFALINMAAVVRVILPLLIPEQTLVWIQLSSGLWMGAFGLFLYVYYPVLVAPRSSG